MRASSMTHPYSAQLSRQKREREKEDRRRLTQIAFPAQASSLAVLELAFQPPLDHPPLAKSVSTPRVSVGLNADNESESNKQEEQAGGVRHLGGPDG